MVNYFRYTEYDKDFYNLYIKERLPANIIDVHAHVTTTEITKDCIYNTNDWAAQCGSVMTYEDYSVYSSFLYPDKKVVLNAIPSVTRGTNVCAGNEYLSLLKKEGKIKYCCMLTDPIWSGELTEEYLLRGNFDGYKPYPDFVAGQKSVDISMFDFVNKEQYEVLNKHKKVMLLHIPRAGRFADKDNIRELLYIREKYPDIKLIVAHCGRSYAINVIREAYRQLGESLKNFYFDIAAVLNPAVLEFMMEKVPLNQIMYGTDLPVFLWHGRRKWTDDEYFNLAREEFPWNKHEEGIEIESSYTFFLYEQLKNILDTTDKFGGKEIAEMIFYKNTVDYFEK